MPTRTFTDEHGISWTVWAVVPSATSVPRANVPTPLAEGWLAFESARGDRRRLAPIPDSWEKASDSHLAQLLAKATPVATRRGRLIE